jgi:multidrug efflux pump subunit AcrB
LVTIVDNIGLPYSGLNLSYSTSAPIGPADADIQVQLTEDHHPTATTSKAAHVLNREYPGVTFYVLPVDIVTQILNFGLSAPIDIQIVGPTCMATARWPRRCSNEVRYVPGAADARIQQPFDYPNMTVNVDRTRAEDHRPDAAERGAKPAGGAERQLPDHPQLLSRPQNGVTYNVAIQAPQYRLDSLAALKSLPVTGATQAAAPQRRRRGRGRIMPARHPPLRPEPLPDVLGNLATIVPGTELGTVSHYDVQPVLDIYTNVDGTDLGTVTRAMEKIIDRHKKRSAARLALHPARPERDHVQVLFGLLGGLAFSILLVYLLIVVNFQSWLDPFLIIAALPAALAGIVWFLFLTHTRLSVPALTGAIMCMGVATSNSILVVTFAREQLEILVGDARRPR